MMVDRNRYRILSFDGGGIWGLVSAVWLGRLEEKLGGQVRDQFDLVAGTSTGSILACAVSMELNAEAIIDLYVKHGREVFPNPAVRLWSRIQRIRPEELDTALGGMPASKKFCVGLAIKALRTAIVKWANADRAE